MVRPQEVEPQVHHQVPEEEVEAEAMAAAEAEEEFRRRVERLFHQRYRG